jgi:putative DNA primase/helicase
MPMSKRREGDVIASPPETFEIALSLAAAGWYVFPVKLVVVTKPDGTVATDKRPLVKWLEGATTDAEQVATWWGSEFTGAWIGVNAARSGIVIVDVDAPKSKDDDRDGKLALEVAGIKLPKTFRYKTRGGGKHHVYRAPEGRALTIARDVPVRGVDIRAGNGLMVYYGPKLEGAPELAKAPKWACLDSSSSGSEKTKHDIAVDEWLAKVRRVEGKAPKPLRKRLAALDYAGLTHDPMLELVNDLVREGATGTPGVATLVDEARGRYIAGRPDRARDWDNALAGSVKHFGAPLTTFAIAKPERKALAVKAKADLESPPVRRNPNAARGIEDNPLAVELAELLAGEWAYTEATGLLQWGGKVWELSTSMALVERVRHELRRIETEEHAKALTWSDETMAKKRLDKLPGLLSARKAKDVAALITGILAKAGLEVDAHPDLLNTQSGVVDLRTGELRAHDPALMLTKITAAAYVPGAVSGDWQRALEALPPKVAAWLQVRFGQAFTGHMTPDDLLPILGGSGENGKSTVIDAVRVAGGDYSVTVPERLLLSNPGDHPTELTTLMGARFAVIEELPEGRNLNVKRLKDAVGTPVMTARRIRQDNVTWRATHSLFLTTNYRPIVAETDHGTWRRLGYVHFPFTFVAPFDADGAPVKLKRHERRGDRGLRKRLGESPNEGVLAWLIEGARLWYADGMPPAPKTVAKATLEWREEADPVLAYFVDRLELDNGYAIPSADLASDFGEWLSARGHREWSQQTVNARFAGHEVFAEVERKKVAFTVKLMPSRPGMMIRPVPANAMAWRGVRFKTSDPSVAPSGAFAEVVKNYDAD